MSLLIGLLMWPFAIIGYLYKIAVAGFMVGQYIAEKNLKE